MSRQRLRIRRGNRKPHRIFVGLACGPRECYALSVEVLEICEVFGDYGLFRVGRAGAEHVSARESVYRGLLHRSFLLSPLSSDRGAGTPPGTSPAARGFHADPRRCAWTRLRPPIRRFPPAQFVSKRFTFSRTCVRYVRTMISSSGCRGLVAQRASTTAIRHGLHAPCLCS